MSFITISCPACGGKIENLEAGMEKYFCPYCGNIIMTKNVMESQPTTASLVIRGNQYLENRYWEEATKYFNRALDIDPTCVEAYLGKVHAGFQFRNTQEALASNIIFTEETSRGPWFQYAIQYAEGTKRQLVEPYNSPERIAKIRALKEKERQENEARNLASEISGLKGTIKRSQEDIKYAEERIAEIQRGISAINTRAFFVLILKVIVFVAVWFGIKKFIGLYDSAVDGFFTVVNVIFVATLIGLVIWCIVGLKRFFTEESACCGKYSNGQKMYKTKPQMKNMLNGCENEIRFSKSAIKTAQEKLQQFEDSK